MLRFPEGVGYGALSNLVAYCCRNPICCLVTKQPSNAVEIYALHERRKVWFQCPGEAELLPAKHPRKCLIDSQVVGINQTCSLR
jgi:hypothetical protein